VITAASANTPVITAASANTPAATAGTPVEEEDDYKMYYIIGLFICFIITMGVVVTLKRVKS